MHKHITKNGDISVAHPYYQHDLAKVGAIQDMVEGLVAGYIADYQEKPTVALLQTAYEYKTKETILPEKAATPAMASPPPAPVMTASIPWQSPPPAIVTTPAVTPVAIVDAATEVVLSSKINPTAKATTAPHPVATEGHATDDERRPSPSASSHKPLTLPAMAFWQNFIELKETVYRGRGALNRMKNANTLLTSTSQRARFRCPSAA